MNNIFVFDIETIPDVEGARHIHGLEGLDDRDTANAMFTCSEWSAFQSHCARAMALRYGP